MTTFIVQLQDGGQAIVEAAWMHETPAGGLEFCADAEPALMIAARSWRLAYRDTAEWEYNPPPTVPEAERPARIIPAL